MKSIVYILGLSLSFASFTQLSAAGVTEKTAEQTDSPDWELTLKVKAAILADDTLSPSNRFVSISTTDGVVTISGKVSSKYQMHEIIKKAESVSGVKKVENQMTVSEDK